jgi:hypothetical protein
VDATHLTPEERRPYIQIGRWWLRRGGGVLRCAAGGLPRA